MDTSELTEERGLWYYSCPQCPFNTRSNLTSRAEALMAKADHKGEHDKK